MVFHKWKTYLMDRLRKSHCHVVCVNCAGWLLGTQDRWEIIVLAHKRHSIQELSVSSTLPCWDSGFLLSRLPSFLFSVSCGLFEFCANLNSAQTPSITCSLIHDLFFWLNCILKVPDLTLLVLMLTAVKWPPSQVTIIHVFQKNPHNVPTVLTQISSMSYYQIW